MNADIRIAVDFYTHPKTRMLEKRLGFAASRSLVILWAWAAKNRPYGNLDGLTDEAIEAAAVWEGDDGALISAFIAIGWLDGDEGARELHDWLVHNPWAAGESERADRGRLNRMKRTHPDLYESLAKNGLKGISKQEYEKLTQPQRFLKQDLSSTQVVLKKSSTTQALLKQPVSPGPTPSPSPTPAPSPKDKKTEEATAEGSDDSLPPEETVALADVIEIWNKTLKPLGIQGVSKATPGRQLDFVTRQRTDPMRRKRSFWHAVIDTVARSDFLRSAPWFNFDWLIGDEERVTRLVEGQYDNRKESGWDFERVESG